MPPKTKWSRPLELSNICDICKRPRSSGNNTVKHTKCSKIRQARYLEAERTA